jgi:hypothetical protein
MMTMHIQAPVWACHVATSSLGQTTAAMTGGWLLFLHFLCGEEWVDIGDCVAIIREINSSHYRCRYIDMRVQRCLCLERMQL